MLLKQVMAKHGVTQAALRQVLVQGNGKPLSAAATSQMLGQGIFPRLMAREEIESKVTEYLTGRGVDAAEIKAAWESLATDHTAATPKSKEITMSQREILTQAAREKFGLGTKHPFIDDVQSRNDVFKSTDTLYVQETMLQAALHGGFLAVVGESGAGKSTLKDDLIEQLRIKNSKTVIVQPRCIDKGRLTASYICDAIIYDVSGSDKTPQKFEWKSRRAETVLTDSLKNGGSHCLLIEEAHDLHLLTIKFLKRIWELKYGFTRLISIILIAQPEILKNKLSERNDEAREVVRRCEIVELKPLNGDDLRKYLKHKFARCQVNLSDVFEDNAYVAIQAALSMSSKAGMESMTYPLIVNNLVIAALNKAAAIGSDKISADLIAAMVQR